MVVSLRRKFHLATESKGTVYDLAIACHGFEERSVNAPRRFNGRFNRGVAIGFDTRKVLSFDENREILAGLSFELHEISDWSVKEFVAGLVKEVERDGHISNVPRIALDCSSFSRLRLAGILSAFSEADGRIDLDVFYSPAKFTEGMFDPEVLRVAEPISFEYSGWNADQESPVAVLIGVGFEDGRATGIAEFLDAPNIHIFNPTGVDLAYDDAVQRANADFFESSPVHTYNVHRPAELFARLESLSYGLRRSHRLSIVPLGPKIFAAAAMLVSFNSDYRDAVWRFSSDMTEDPIPKFSDGSCCVLPVRLTASPPAEVIGR